MTLQTPPTPAKPSWVPSIRELLGAWDRAWVWLAERRSGRPTDPRLAFVPEYDAVFAELGASELQQDEEPLDEEALSLDLFHPEARSTDRFLGFYTEQGARMAFERYGFFDLLRERGFDPLPVGDVSDAEQHRLRIYDGVEEPEHLLVELVVGIREMTLPNGVACRFLFVNWLLMQNPTASFDAGQVALPDQERPGLGLFVRFAYLLKLMAARIGCDGLLNHPAHPHNGVLYGQVSSFVDPSVEGRFRAMGRDVDTSDLAQLTGAVREGRVVDEAGEPFVWEPTSQVMPVSDAARSWFASPTYRAQVAEVMGARRYTVRPATPSR